MLVPYKIPHIANGFEVATPILTSSTLIHTLHLNFGRPNNITKLSNIAYPSKHVKTKRWIWLLKIAASKGYFLNQSCNSLLNFTALKCDFQKSICPKASTNQPSCANRSEVCRPKFTWHFGQGTVWFTRASILDFSMMPVNQQSSVK